MSAFDFDVIGDAPPARRIVPPGLEPPAAAKPAAKAAVPQPPDRSESRRRINAGSPVEVG